MGNESDIHSNKISYISGLRDFNSVQIRSPLRSAMIIPSSYEYKVNKWQKRIDDIVYKYKSRMSIIRSIIKVAIKILLSLASVGLLFLFILKLSQYDIWSPLMTIATGYLWSQILIIIWIFDYWINTDTYFIKFKHRNKIY